MTNRVFFPDLLSSLIGRSPVSDDDSSSRERAPCFCLFFFFLSGKCCPPPINPKHFCGGVVIFWFLVFSISPPPAILLPNLSYLERFSPSTLSYRSTRLTDPLAPRRGEKFVFSSCHTTPPVQAERAFLRCPLPDLSLQAPTGVQTIRFAPFPLCLPATEYCDSGDFIFYPRFLFSAPLTLSKDSPDR